MSRRRDPTAGVVTDAASIMFHCQMRCAGRANLSERDAKKMRIRVHYISKRSNCACWRRNFVKASIIRQSPSPLRIDGGRSWRKQLMKPGRHQHAVGAGLPVVRPPPVRARGKTPRAKRTRPRAGCSVWPAARRIAGGPPPTRAAAGRPRRGHTARPPRTMASHVDPAVSSQSYDSVTMHLAL